jgi:hypothetical protein
VGYHKKLVQVCSVSDDPKRLPQPIPQMREHRGVSASRSPPRESFSFSKRHGMLLLHRLDSSHACVRMWCSISDRMERCISDCTARRRLWCLTPDSYRKVSLLGHLNCFRYSGCSTHDRQWQQSTLLIANVACLAKM